MQSHDGEIGCKSGNEPPPPVPLFGRHQFSSGHTVDTRPDAIVCRIIY